LRWRALAPQLKRDPLGSESQMRAGTRERQMISGLAGRLTELHPKIPTHVSLLGFMAGALHALDRAAQLNYSDARAQPERERFAAEFRTSIRAIARRRRRPNAWLAGFYLDSALMRLSALNTRLNKVLGTDDDRIRVVRRIVNSLKHEPDAHIAKGWTLRFTDAIGAAKILSDRLLIAIQ
jgi:hypothetical protein